MALIRAAREAEDRGDNHAAVIALNTAITMDPENASLWTWLGHLQVEEEQYSEATEVLKKALEIDPRSVAAHASLGLAFLRLRRLTEAEASLRQAVELGSRPCDMILLAEVLSQQGRGNDAESTLRLVLSMEPNNEEALFNLAMIIRSRDFRHALSLLQLAVEVDPHFAMAHREIGWCMTRLGRSDDAEHALRTALRLDNEDIWTYMYLASVLETRGRMPEAEGALHHACRLAPLLALPHRLLGHFYNAQGHAANAEASYRRAWDLDRKDYDSGIALAHYLIENDQRSEAQHLAREMLSETFPNPATREALNRIAGWE